MRKPGPFSTLSSIRKNFFDNFNRNDTEDGLGNAPDGRLWDKVRGVFQISEQKALSFSDPETYPITSVTFPHQDVVVSIDEIQNGTGASFWITDSGNWWGIGLEEEEVECNCSVATDCNRWNVGGLCSRWNVGNCSSWNARNCRREECGAWNANTCSGGFNTSNCSSWSVRWLPPGVFGPPVPECQTWNTRNCRSWSGSTCSRFDCVRWNARNCRSWNTGGCNQWTTETCNRWFEFTFDCETCYPQWIRVFQSINSTVSTVARFLITKTFRSEPSPQGNIVLFFQENFVDKIIQKIKIFTKKDEIKASLFYDLEDQDKVEVEEEIIYKATGAEINTSYGIIVFPSKSNQNIFLGSFRIEKN